MDVPRRLLDVARADAGPGRGGDEPPRRAGRAWAGILTTHDAPSGLALALAGGGTGGHVVPGLHVLRHLVARGEALRDILWFGVGRPVEDRALAGLAELLGDVPFERVTLPLEPPRGGAPSLARVVRRTPTGVRLARRALRAHRSRVVLALGGTTTLPVVIAARLLGLPVALLELNAVAGRATRWTSCLARRVFHAWPSTLPGSPRGRHVLIGPPLAPSFASGAPSDEEAAAARAALGYDPARPLLLVLGGSQGSLPLNRFCREWAPKLAGAGVQVLHQVGPGRRQEACEAFSGYRSEEYLDDVAGALAAATAVLCRGGASTLAEVAARARPALVVPYPHHADRHQEWNARSLGAGVRIVPEERLGAGLVDELVALCGPAGAQERRAMAQTLAGSIPRDACRRPCDELLGLASGSGPARSA